jgi:preprotein translocase subunit SecA
MGVLDRVLRTGEGKRLRALQGLVPDINALEPTYQAMSDDELKHQTVLFRERLANGEDLDDIMLEAFAVCREAAVRVLHQRHYDVQMMGGAALHFGWVAEMKTGEGKTLTSTLPLYLNGLSGKGTHIITVNEYLATFQSEWMGRLFKWLGLTVGLIVPGNRDADHKREQYAADITYGINNEFGFDYLRDNMAMSRDRQVQRGFNYAIVDEVDSILIDEARTPLIISGRLEDAAKLYTRFAAIARGLRRDEHYEVDEEKRLVVPTEEGIEKVEEALGVDNLYDGVAQNLVHQFQVALRAKELFRRDKDYIVVDGEVKIVDEFTGRVLDGRRWSEGLHQAVEAKEGVPIKEENQTLATITLQNYFRMYDKLAGMTGTATSEAAELASTYGLQVVPIPTNEPVVRADEGDLIYKTLDGKLQAIADDVEERYKAGQPVLVGTASVATSEVIARTLDKRGVPHQVLNAKPERQFREADIVAQAGRLHTVTVATNMAGRGVDILLGGNPELLAKQELHNEGLDPETDDSPETQERYQQALGRYETECKAEGAKVRELGGLYVLGTERHDSRRIDLQLRGRAGRQGDPGESRFYLSLEDDLMRLFATGAVNWVMGKALPDDVPLEAKMVTKAIERAQQTVEQRNAEIRKNVLKYDEVLNSQRKVIYELRDQILDKTDLRAKIVDKYLPEAVESLVGTYCVADFNEEWDLEGLVAAAGEYWPSEVTVDQLAALDTSDQVYEVLVDEALTRYEARESELGDDVMRQVERQVMLRIIDTAWREHLREMDYLQEGINLRAMGQRDPLMEWQREGFEMFESMIARIERDLVRYVMHVQVKPPEPEQPQAPAVGMQFQTSGPAADAGGGPLGGDEPALANVQTSGPADPSTQAGGLSTMARTTNATGAAAVAGAPERVEESAPSGHTPVVKSDWDKTPRNAPCPCGSGKKFKLCHGRS